MSNLEELWQKYLELGGVKEEQLNEIQRKEMKKAFFGGCSSLLTVFFNEIAELDENKGVQALDNLFKEAETYWRTELLSHVNN